MRVDDFGDRFLVTEKIMFGWCMFVVRRGVTEAPHIQQMRMGHERACNVPVVSEEWHEHAIGP